ncbi:MAG: MCE family protein [Candidatus Eisenbacteria bacterium]|nr:MCE family protein [Candidatus Eisenbacteria bacterium]
MSRRTEVQVGITVLVALVTLLWGVTYLKDLTLQRKVTVWKVRFPQTGGLGPSDEVQVNGIRKGLVTKIELAGDAVFVDLGLDSDVKLTSDSKGVDPQRRPHGREGDLRRAAHGRPPVHGARHDPRHLRARHGRGDGPDGRHHRVARQRREAACAHFEQARGER